MQKVIRLVQGDSLPTITFYVKRVDENGHRTPVDLSSVNTVANFKFRLKGDDTLLNEGHTLCNIVDAPNGKVTYTWQVGDLANSGQHEAELEITFGTGGIQTVYEIINFDVRKQF